MSFGKLCDVIVALNAEGAMGQLQPAAIALVGLYLAQSALTAAYIGMMAVVSASTALLFTAHRCFTSMLSQ
eukprot:SAG11_NODE_983_length_6306_cov_19.831319_6_plen_71_part_00